MLAAGQRTECKFVSEGEKRFFSGFGIQGMRLAIAATRRLKPEPLPCYKGK